jgi:hypothetical protein
LEVVEVQVEELVGRFGVQVVEEAKSLPELLRCQEISLSLLGKAESNLEIAIQLAHRVVQMVVIQYSVHRQHEQEKVEVQLQLADQAEI